MAYPRDYEKRKFLEATSVSIAVARIINGDKHQEARSVVNYAGELWDEIEHQCPRPKDQD